jgi:hypothetical protein
VLTPLTLPGFGHFTDLGNGSGTLNIDPDFTDAGVYTIEILATDNDTNALSDTLIFTLTVTNVNRSPVLAAIASQQVNEGETLVVPVTASDPDGDALSFSAPGLPGFGTLSDNGDGSGSLQFTPGFSDAGSYTITVVVNDGGTPSLSDTTTFQLTVAQVNLPPAIAAIPDTSVAEGGELTITLSASDPDNDTVAFFAENLPTFAEMSDSGNGHGILRFHPGFADAGVYPDIRIIAVDAGLAADTTIFQLTVTDSNSAPIAKADTVILSEDQAGVLQVLQNDFDPNGDPIKISAVLDTIANGAVLILPGDSALQYEPQANFFGELTFRYEIVDTAGLADTASVLLKILPVNDPPQISGLPDSIRISGDSVATVNLIGVITDIDDPFTSLTIDLVTQPDTLDYHFVPDSGIVKISAKNPAASVVAEVFITVTDTSGASVSDTIVVQVIGTVGIDESMANIPKKFEVFQNYPNPFNPTTTIKFALPASARVKVSIFNILGQRVAVLLDEMRPAGYHQIVFDASTISSGMYLYVVETKSNREIRKMLLIK